MYSLLSMAYVERMKFSVEFCNTSLCCHGNMREMLLLHIRILRLQCTMFSLLLENFERS